MKITALVENTSHNPEIVSRHGLSFYIQTRKHKVLFDLGPDDTIFKNAERLGVNLEEVDTVVISHGHVDHGGALKRFIEINPRATIYIQKSAFDRFYVRILLFRKYIGLDRSLKEYENLRLLEGDFRIDDELSLFTTKSHSFPASPMNRNLYNEDRPDDFIHEQNLLICEDRKVLFTGCCHNGVINILRNSPVEPDLCIGGFHLSNPVTGNTADRSYLKNFSDQLEGYKDIEFYTCHCTGKKAFEFLANENSNIKTIRCGEVLRS